MRPTPRRLLRSFTVLSLIVAVGGVTATGPATAAPITVAPASAPITVTPVTAAATTHTTATVLLTASRPSKVTVPAEYVYDPKLGALHDYCTYAPDEFAVPFAPNADFRGPCARHDLCYAGSTDQKVCDRSLRRNMFRNCRHYYGKRNPLRAACYSAAVTYWAAVVAT